MRFLETTSYDVTLVVRGLGRAFLCVSVCLSVSARCSPATRGSAAGLGARPTRPGRTCPGHAAAPAARTAQRAAAAALHPAARAPLVGGHAAAPPTRAATADRAAIRAQRRRCCRCRHHTPLAAPPMQLPSLSPSPSPPRPRPPPLLPPCRRRPRPARLRTNGPRQSKRRRKAARQARQAAGASRATLAPCTWRAPRRNRAAARGTLARGKSACRGVTVHLVRVRVRVRVRVMIRVMVMVRVRVRTAHHHSSQ